MTETKTRRNRAESKIRKRKFFFVYGMLFLPLLQFCIFYVWLNFNSILMAFQESYRLDWSGGFPKKTSEIIYGLGNFKAIFRDQGGILSVALKNTLYYFLMNILVTLPGSLLISYFLFKKVKGSAFFRVVFFLPSIISGIVYVASFTEIIGMYGPLYYLLKAFGGTWKNLLIYADTATPTILFYSLWTGFGVNMLLYQSGMSRIPGDVFESGKIDGVGWVRELFQIALPLMWPTISMTLVMAFTGIFTGGGIVLLFASQGGNSADISTIYYWIFAKTDAEGASGLLGDAAAVGLFFTLLSFPILALIKWITNKVDPQVEY